MNEQENTNEISFSKPLELVALITVVFTPILFILGHLSAYWYFSSFDIPYFKYTDTNTAFNFALKSLDVMLSVIALIFILITGIAVMNSFAKKHEDSQKEKSEIKRTKTQQVFVLFKLIPKVILLAIAILIIVTYLGNVIISLDFKKQIETKHYIPYEITYNKGLDTLKCVTSIGSIGQYQVFLSQSFQTILIPETNITSVKKMFAPFPIKELPDGKRTLANPYYDKELEIWLSKWKSDCPNEDVETFKYFEFSTSGRSIVER